MRKVVVAGGCFWGVEEYYKRLKGIHTTKVGYAQSDVENPSYKQVCDHITTAVEAVYLEYDESVISLETIINHLFRIIDPTQKNRQGNDIGAQYRTGIYLIEDKVEEVKALVVPYQTSEKFFFEIEHLENFYLAEDYHQEYLRRNPSGYCHVSFSHIKPEELK